MNGENISLRPVEPQDLDLIYKWENDPELWIVSSTHTPFSRNTLQKYLDSIHDIFKDEQLRMVITDQKNDIGLVDLFEMNTINRRVGVGILIDVKYRNHGYASEAIRLILDYAFNTLHMNQVFCNILEDNQVSINLFEKLGFKNSGRKKSWVLKDDKWHDELIYQKFRS